MTAGVRRVWNGPRVVHHLESDLVGIVHSQRQEANALSYRECAPSEHSIQSRYNATYIIALVAILSIIAIGIPSVLFYRRDGHMTILLGGALTGGYRHLSTELSAVFDIISSKSYAAISRETGFERHSIGQKESRIGNLHAQTAGSRPDAIDLLSSRATAPDQSLSSLSPKLSHVSENDRHLGSDDSASSPPQADIALAGNIRDARPSWELSKAATNLSKEMVDAWRRGKRVREQGAARISNPQELKLRRSKPGDYMPRTEDAANGEEVALPTAASLGTPSPVPRGWKPAGVGLSNLNNKSFQGICGDAPMHLLPLFMQLGLLQAKAERDENDPGQLRKLRFVDDGTDPGDAASSGAVPSAWHAGSGGSARSSRKRAAWTHDVQEEEPGEGERASPPRRTRSHRIPHTARLDGLAHAPSARRAGTAARPGGRAAANVQLAAGLLRRGALVPGGLDGVQLFPPPVPPALPARELISTAEPVAARAHSRHEPGPGLVSGPAREVGLSPRARETALEGVGQGPRRPRGARRPSAMTTQGTPSLAHGNLVAEPAADVAAEVAAARDAFVMKCLEGGKLTRTRCTRAWNLTSSIRNFPVPADGATSQFFPEAINHEHIRHTLLGGVNIDGWLLVKNAGCRGVPGRVMAENPSKDAPVGVNVRDGEEMLVQCMRDPGVSCHLAEARRGAAALPSTKLIQRAPKGGQNPLGIRNRQFESCALVGNGGGLLHHEYGKHIDNHEVVVRFNLAPVPGNLSRHVGSKTSFMVLGHRPSAELCCEGATGSMSKDELGKAQYILWTPPGEINDDIRSACHARQLGSQVHEMAWPVLKRFSHAMRIFRRDVQRLGLGDELGSWTQMTSGAHAVFLFSKMCKSVDLYGFTTFPVPQDTPDQFWGRQHKSRSGTMAHDWEMESHLWRLMYLSGHINICT